MKKPRILLICPFYPPNTGGVETHLKLLADYLKNSKYPTTVLTYKPLTTHTNSYKSYEKSGCLDVHRYWWFGRQIFDKTTPYPILQFLYIVPGLLVNSLIFMFKNHQRIDVIHSHGFAASFIARVISLFYPNKIYVASTHFIYQKLKKDSLYSKIFYWTFKVFSHILLVNQKSGKELVQIGLDPNKMQQFRHWLDEKVFKPESKTETRKLLNLPLDKPIVLFVGRIIRMKGIFQLLEAARSLPQIDFLLIGSGLDFEELKQKSSGVSNFKLLGRMEHLDIIKYYNSADIFILPSQNPEAQPMTIMESLFCSCPVITTNKGAAQNMIDGTCGLVIEPTPKNIKAAISSLLKNKKRLSLMGKSARRFARQHYSTRNADIIVKNYHAKH